MKEKDLGDELKESLSVFAMLMLLLVGEISVKSSKGIDISDIIAGFVKDKKSYLSAALTALGMAGGGYIAAAIWTSQLGLLAGVGYTLGIVTMPVWVPVAGGITGLACVGGLIYGINSFAFKHNKTRVYEIVVFYARKILSRTTDYPVKDIENEIAKLLASAELSKNDIDKILKTDIANVTTLIKSNFNEDECKAIIRILFPLAYISGEYEGITVEQFNAICDDLGIDSQYLNQLNEEFINQIDKQWKFYDETLNILARINDSFEYTEDEKNLMKKEFDFLMNFDPRITAQKRRKKTLNIIGTIGAIGGVAIATNGAADAAIVTAYAISQANITNPERRNLFKNIFEKHLLGDPTIDDKSRNKILKDVSVIDNSRKGTENKKNA